MRDEPLESGAAPTAAARPVTTGAHAGVVILLGAVAVALLAAAFAWAHLRSWNDHQKLQDQALEAHAQRSAAQVARILGGADLLLANLAAQARRDGVGPQLQPQLQVAQGGLRDLATLVVYNGAGEPVATSAGFAPTDRTARFDPTLFRTAPDVVVGFQMRETAPGGSRALTVARRIVGETGELAGVAVASIAHDGLFSAMRGAGLPADAVIELTRQDGTVLMRDPVPAGVPPSAAWRREPEMRGLLGQHASGTADTVSGLDGVRRVQGYVRIPEYQLIVLAGLPEADRRSRWWRAAGPEIALELLLLAGLALLGWAAARRVVQQEAHRAALTTARRDLEVQVQDRTLELERTVEKLQAVAEERQLLFRDLNHRIRNNLQLISSLLRLQAGRLSDPTARAAFEDSLERVNSISLVHDILYQTSGTTSVDFGSLLRTLSERLATVFAPDGRVKLTLAANHADVSLDVAIRLCLVLNEVLSNVFKHSFADQRSGTVHVGVKVGERVLSLTVIDDGAGPSMTLPSGEARLGTQLVELLARNLNALVTRDDQDGRHRFELSMPV